MTISTYAQPHPAWRLKELGEGLYFLTDGAYNTMFLVGDGGVIAVDPLPTLGQGYLDAIRSVTDKPIRYVVYSHSHTDHIGASYLFPKEAKVVAQKLVAERLADAADPRRRLPDITFDSELSLSLGNQVLELHYPGPNHELGNILIYAPKQRVLMLVDVVYPGFMPYKNLGIAEDVLGYEKAHDWALQFPFETFVGGHVGEPGSRADVKTSLEFVRDLKSVSARALAETSFPKYLAEHPTADAWDMHNRYEMFLVDQVYVELLPKWKNRLKDTDTYLRDNCWAMIEAIIVQLPPAS